MILTRPFRKPFWIISSFVKKHQRLIIFAALIGVIIFLFTKDLIPFIPQPKPKIKVGVVGQYTLNNLPAHISHTISRGIMSVDPAGLITPDLAESWQVSQDETVYTVYLKPDLFWSDGTPLISEDIEFEIPDVAVSYPDDLTIEFHLKESFSPFLVTLSRPLFKQGNIGAAEFLIKSIRYQGPFIKSLNLIGPQRNIIYRFYASNQTAWTGFRLGEIDRLENLFSNPLDDHWLDKLTLETATNNNQYLAVVFNLNHKYFSVKPLRQALAYAIKDKNPDQAKRALTPINPNSWAYNSKVKAYDYNPSQVKELFETFTEEATFSGQLTLTLATSESFLKLAESIANSWEETLDIKVPVKIVNSIEEDFEALLIAQEIPQDPDQHALWHSTQPTNLTNYSDLKVDKLLEDGRKISDPKKRLEIYQDFQRFLVEDSPAIFLMHPTTYTISRQ